ncbi:pleckstrin homology domain-containing family A member 8-like isoform X2 [Oscarella lobularis]|uniref:pleckstrin homology domain-containing family A member 8-like isoform X2 n=1 Tax=Oscarella lobularis TaxID=121494 RepID=UPI003313BF33
MNGLLSKWTNYLTGWQLRWFKLDMTSGELSYYRSEEEVGQGSRGSIKLASCDIAVHSSDPLRMDLYIRGASHKRLYLRAGTTQERQKWLVALGSAKACLLESKEQGVPLSSLKEKMAELHMVCQLVVDQVASIKNHSQEPINVEGLSECATMLSATCGSFLTVLADCMDMADHSMTAGESPTTVHPKKSFHDFADALNSKNKSVLQLHLPKDKLLSSSLSSSLSRQPKSDTEAENSDSVTSSLTESTPAPPPPAPAQPLLESPLHSLSSPPTQRSTYEIHATLETPQFQFYHPDGIPVISGDQTIIPDAVPSPSFPPRVASPDAATGAPSEVSSTQSDAFASAVSSPVVTPAESDSTPPDVTETDAGGGQRVSPKPKRKHATFFSKSTHRFEDVEMDSECNISTSDFLSACKEILPFIDIVGGSAFAPVKMDINGNITKLSKKYKTNPRKFHTLQQIVNDELANNTSTARNSATDALLWLKRGLEFIHCFLIEVVHGQQDLTVAAGKAYERTLRRFHGWIVRGVFALAVKAVPYRVNFMKALGMPEGGSEEQVVRDAVSMANALGSILSAINLYYQKHNLDTAATA